MRKLEAKLGERLELMERENRKGLDLVKIDRQRRKRTIKDPLCKRVREVMMRGISERHGRQERYARHKRIRDEPRREEMDGMKFKILPFLGERKIYSYLD
ncbi:hypothetical protein CR513_01383, partial [Mucuna pruriens]